ncbi:MAG: hypothetical protein MHPSP_000934 [Paramarteilia canceri]
MMIEQSEYLKRQEDKIAFLRSENGRGSLALYKPTEKTLNEPVLVRNNDFDNIYSDNSAISEYSEQASSESDFDTLVQNLESSNNCNNRNSSSQNDSSKSDDSCLINPNNQSNRQKYKRKNKKRYSKSKKKSNRSRKQADRLSKLSEVSVSRKILISPNGVQMIQQNVSRVGNKRITETERVTYKQGRRNNEPENDIYKKKGSNGLINMIGGLLFTAAGPNCNKQPQSTAKYSLSPNNEPHVQEPDD